MTTEEIEQIKAEARRLAEEDVRRWGQGQRHRVFTDGLGALGAGSLPGGPGEVQQAEYDRIVFAD